jgi:hypothetical protein
MTAYIIVSVVTALINIWAATNDFVRPKWLLTNMTKLSVSESSLNSLGLLKIAGAFGVLVGIGVPIVGVVAAIGLIVFFLAAITTHLRARDYSVGYGGPLVFLALAVVSLVLELNVRGAGAFALLAH